MSDEEFAEYLEVMKKDLLYGAPRRQAASAVWPAVREEKWARQAAQRQRKLEETRQAMRAKYGYAGSERREAERQTENREE